MFFMEILSIWHIGEQQRKAQSRSHDKSLLFCFFYMQNFIFTNVSFHAKIYIYWWWGGGYWSIIFDTVCFSMKPKAIKKVRVCKRFNIFQ